MILRAASETDLPVVRTWFDDAATQRWLGGRDWPDESLRLRGPGRQSYVALADSGIVGFIDCEQYEDCRASFAIVVAPVERGRGLGRTIVEAVTALPENGGIEEFFAGIELSNLASEKLVLAAGFVPVSDPDEDGFRYFAWWRHGRPDEVWARP
ncbi:GNAT family N-acetyltransferase [Devosia ginsengisoli]|uniref:GNAT family N-acetyltransferase n=1 Tax=Devosia ginsengisoli TaxID=400770 RepID=A0A5B8LN55_9HYPH|nr:GNAT family N-acetyltransferase [Devosia ginsengisoli]QDZ09399.1 GNAT family N-acetyltransferase [Devosia ginsengisoli]